MHDYMNYFFNKKRDYEEVQKQKQTHKNKNNIIKLNYQIKTQIDKRF